MKSAHSILSLFLGSVLLLLSASGVWAASLKLSPASGSYDEGDSFSVKLDLVVSSESVDGVDAVLNFDEDKLEVTQITEGTLFDNHPVKSFDNTNGKITISALVASTNPVDPVTTSGTIATITFKAIDGGTAAVDFVLQTDDSVNYSYISENETSNNILSGRTNGSYTITADDGADDDGDTGGFGGAGTTTTLPSAGHAEQLLFLLGGGITLMIIGLLSRKYQKLLQK
ncbi:hypothetical protein GYA49_04385 [Candidatus Beckwithbacteria bacterium]|nr:hypothetical protein [Candidatus Beckwithbacteria bacterium]